MQNIKYLTPPKLPVWQFFKVSHPFDLVVNRNLNECASLLEDKNNPYIAASIREKVVHLRHIPQDDTYGFHIIEYGRFLPKVEAVGQMHRWTNDKTRLIGETRIQYEGHLTLWLMALFITAFFALSMPTTSSTIALATMLFVNAVILIEFVRTLYGREKLLRRIEETLQRKALTIE